MANSASSNELHSITKHNNIVISGVGANEVLKFDGSNWINQTLAESGIAPVASPTFTTGATSPAWITGNNGTVKFNDSDGSHYFTLAANATTTTSIAYTWPVNAGTDNYVLTTNGSGVLTWEEVVGGTSVAGTTDNGLLTFVNSGSTFAAEANLTFDGTHLSIAAQGKIFFDGGSNTYIQELTANNMAFYADGGKQLTIGAGLIMNSDISAQNISFQGSTGFTGDTKVTSGNLVIGTAGKGIDFSINTDAGAASGITTDSELLDYYEEGTFTPLVDQGWPHTSNGMAHSTQFGHYTKIGNRVHINLRVITTGFGDCGTGSAGMAVRGLPFVCDSTGNSETGIMLAYSASMSGTVAHTITGVTDANGNAKIYIRQSQTDGSGVSASVTRDELSATCTMNFSGMYEVD